MPAMQVPSEPDTDYFLHIREGSTSTGWVMEPMTFDDLRAQLLKTEQSFRLSKGVPYSGIDMDTIMAAQSQRTSMISYEASSSTDQSSSSSSGHTFQSFPSIEVDSGYGSSHESPVSVIDKSRSFFSRDRSKTRPRTSSESSTSSSKLRKRSRSRKPSKTEEEPLSTESSSSSSASAPTRTSTPQPTTPPRGRGLSLKRLTSFGSPSKSKSKSKERSRERPQSQWEMVESPSEEIPPVPPLPNLPIAMRFMSRPSPFQEEAPPASIPPPDSRLKELSPELWNNDTLISARRSTFFPKDQRQKAGSSSPSPPPPVPPIPTAFKIPESSLSSPSSNALFSPHDDAVVRLNSRVQLTTAKAYVVPVPQPSLQHPPQPVPSITIANFPYPPPPIPESPVPEEPQPRSFLSMSSSTIGLTDEQIAKAKKKNARKTKQFLVPFSSGGENGSGGGNSEGFGGFGSMKRRFTLKGIVSARAQPPPVVPPSPQTPSPSSFRPLPPASSPSAEERHFSYIEVETNEAIMTPMSWIEIPAGTIIAPGSSLPQELTMPSPTEYNPYSPVPASALFAQAIPSIARGRESPFPQRPILPHLQVPRPPLRITAVVNAPPPSRYRDLVFHNAAATETIQEFVIEEDPEEAQEPGEKSAYSEGVKTAKTGKSATTIVGKGWYNEDMLDEYTSSRARAKFEEAVGKMRAEERQLRLPSAAQRSVSPVPILSSAIRI